MRAPGASLAGDWSASSEDDLSAGVPAIVAGCRQGRRAIRRNSTAAPSTASDRDQLCRSIEAGLTGYWTLARSSCRAASAVARIERAIAPASVVIEILLINGS